MIKQCVSFCECYGCENAATMCVTTRPERMMLLCDYHTGEMIAHVVMAQGEKKEESK